ncbi:hypothetical protein HUK80_07165 [Flavobacterium sp. MAH-1]|uniref:Uncharacterized protein n=1 Tax=Flavobacterium agri TaxID=2743471 RepID=A0A7Y8Y2H3_9FLAO|nr:hypothetical protein [Flavobacterium agri]NUY80669.1 hypothetical protein [Flavobacterium agri]NYA70693.1 hypothetical protein [Flavobacterium agri]
MNKLLLLFVFMLGFSANAQTKILRFSEAENQGVSSHELDKIYKSAVHTDPKLAVFKTDEEQQRLQKAYVQFFSDFGKYLNDNQFKWESKTRCFNRIYMQKDGTVDYFLFDFGKNPLSETTENRFRQLLSEFLKTHKFPIAASEKFAQCSPITYQ